MTKKTGTAASEFDDEHQRRQRAHEEN